MNHHHQKQHQNSNQAAKSSDDYGYCHYPPKRQEIVAAEASPAVVCVRFGGHKICSDNVDTLAEEFIKWEHRKFEASKTMSINYG
ncbi:hypothetical protein LINGRAHAP2_LOCUS3412 [Linum grandiflorum]